MDDALKVVVPIFLAWALPKLFDYLSERYFKLQPQVKARIVYCLYALAISVTTIVVYDRFFVAKDMVAFAHEDGVCPKGYRDMSTVVIARWKDAPERFVTAKDDARTGNLSADWPFDHIKLCLRQ